MQDASRRSQTDIVNLRIRAPDAASSDRDLEFAGKIVEVSIACQHARGFERQRRSIANLIGIDPSDRTTRNITSDIAAGAGRVQSHLSERFEDLWERFDGDPVQLNVLPHCDVGNSVSV